MTNYTTKLIPMKDYNTHILHSQNFHNVLPTCTPLLPPCHPIIASISATDNLDLTPSRLFVSRETCMNTSYFLVNYPTTISLAERSWCVLILFFPSVTLVVSRGLLIPNQSNTAHLLSVVFCIRITEYTSWPFFMLTEQRIRCISTLNPFLVRNKLPWQKQPVLK